MRDWRVFNINMNLPMPREHVKYTHICFHCVYKVETKSIFMKHVHCVSCHKLLMWVFIWLSSLLYSCNITVRFRLKGEDKYRNPDQGENRWNEILWLLSVKTWGMCSSLAGLVSMPGILEKNIQDPKIGNQTQTCKN